MAKPASLTAIGCIVPMAISAMGIVSSDEVWLHNSQSMLDVSATVYRFNGKVLSTILLDGLSQNATSTGSLPVPLPTLFQTMLRYADIFLIVNKVRNDVDCADDTQFIISGSSNDSTM